MIMLINLKSLTSYLNPPCCVTEADCTFEQVGTSGLRHVGSSIEMLDFISAGLRGVQGNPLVPNPVENLLCLALFHCMRETCWFCSI